MHCPAWTVDGSTHSLLTSVSIRRFDELCCWELGIISQTRGGESHGAGSRQRDTGGSKSMRQTSISIREKRLDSEMAYHNRSGLSLEGLEELANCTREWGRSKEEWNEINRMAGGHQTTAASIWGCPYGTVSEANRSSFPSQSRWSRRWINLSDTAPVLDGLVMVFCVE